MHATVSHFVIITSLSSSTFIAFLLCFSPPQLDVCLRFFIGMEIQGKYVDDPKVIIIIILMIMIFVVAVVVAVVVVAAAAAAAAVVVMSAANVVLCRKGGRSPPTSAEAAASPASLTSRPTGQTRQTHWSNPADPLVKPA